MPYLRAVVYKTFYKWENQRSNLLIITYLISNLIWSRTASFCLIKGFFHICCQIKESKSNYFLFISEKRHWVQYARDLVQCIHHCIFIEWMTVLPIPQNEGWTRWGVERICATAGPPLTSLDTHLQGLAPSGALAEGSSSLFSFLIQIARSLYLTWNWLWQHILFTWISSQLFFFSSLL